MNSLKQQQGAVLIVVLVVLLLTTMLGVYAIRQSTTRLNISSNLQITAELSSLADNAMKAVIPELTTNLTADTHPVAYLNKTENIGIGAEVLFCYRPVSQSVVYKVSETSAVAPPIGTTTVTTSTNANDTFRSIDSTRVNGVCNLTKLDTDGNSQRGFGATQVSVTKVANPPDWPEGQIYRVYVTAIGVSPFAGNIQDVQTNCMNKRLNDDIDAPRSDDDDGNLARESLGECLAQYGVPYQTKVQEIVVEAPPTGKGHF